MEILGKMDETLVNLKRPYTPDEFLDDEEATGLFSFPELYLPKDDYDIDKNVKLSELRIVIVLKDVAYKN